MKQEKEIKVVTLMIQRYCRGNHKTKKQLCPSCNELLEYVNLRRNKCPHGKNKPFCSNCSIQCYHLQYKQQIRAVMRYSGLRIVFRHPIITFSHLIASKKQKKKLEREAKNND